MECLGVTGELSESKQFEWKIPNFLSLPAKEDEFYISPSFVFANTSFNLRIYPAGDYKYPRGFNEFRNEYLLVRFECESFPPILFSCILHIEKADGAFIGGGTRTSFFQCAGYHGYQNVFSRSNLEVHKSELLPSGILTIICILKWKNDGEQGASIEEKVENSHEKQAQETENQKKITDFDELCKNLRDLFNDEDTCDVVLQVEDKEFKGHKIILMSRSSVFAAMFKHDTLESRTGIVKISDCDSESFQEFLEFLYCGKLENISFRSAFHLYSTSNKYDVKNLRVFCMDYLMKNLTPDNVCDIVMLADKYDETKLLSAAQAFFNENMSKIILTSEWEDLMKNNYRLANKLLIEMTKVKSSH